MHKDQPGTLLDRELPETQDYWAPRVDDIAVTPAASAEPVRASAPTVWAVPQRRRERRIHPVRDQIWIQWWNGEEVLGRPGQLVNVSRHGAMIITSALFHEYQKIRIYMEEPAPQIGATARVLAVVEGLHGVNQFRLEFATLCPDAFFEHAAVGFEAWLERDASRF